MRTCAQNFANAFRRCCGRSSCCDGRRRHNSCGKVIILGSSGIFIGLDDDDVGSSSVWSYLVGFAAAVTTTMAMGLIALPQVGERGG